MVGHSVWGCRDARRGPAGGVGTGEASSPLHNPCMGEGNDTGLKKPCVVFISYNPNDVFWIALLRG